jgi:hypothetical protein
LLRTEGENQLVVAATDLNVSLTAATTVRAVLENRPATAMTQLSGCRPDASDLGPRPASHGF